MKTIEERANIMFDALELYKGAEKEIIIEAIKKLLKEQDKITRHACAEAVLNLEKETITDLRTDEVIECIEVNSAHSTIMNTKTV